MNPELQHARLESALAKARHELLEQRNGDGYWTGELSSSALSTATAICALSVAQRERKSPAYDSLIAGGLKWLADHANLDGGWGDTILSLSNISTTALCWAAFGAVPGADDRYRTTLRAVESWLAKHAGGIAPELLAPAIIRRYGKDRTFSVPILTMCALAGRLGTGQEAWRWVIPLPFELAACPHQWFAALRLPVVSYALPALIAIGQARHYHLPSRNFVARMIRRMAKAKTLRVLEAIQPSGGGFLEATPLTSFVVMSLASSGQADSRVTTKGLEFLVASARSDGSWPIDTNLATWVTTLSVNALSGGRSSASAETSSALDARGKQQIRDWLLGQQYLKEHPYTHSPPGGWAWTNLPGGVPDADDTAGALLALANLGEGDDRAREAAIPGVEWLLGLQNRDGGIPTFCRGWGALPFDRSSPDLTAHAFRAWLIWMEQMPAHLQERLRRAIERGISYLGGSQNAEGSWTPLWFGNQFAPDDVNPTYGTARVLPALVEAESRGFQSRKMIERGVNWLVAAQKLDGSWGGFPEGQSSIEETSLAVEALAAVLNHQNPQDHAVRSAVVRATFWLSCQVETDRWKNPAPIGFYFAKLWYYERLYPLIFAVGALRQAAAALR